MRVLYDAQQLSEQMTGVGYYSDHVLRSMLKLDKAHDWLLLCHRSNADYVGKISAACPRAGTVVLREPISLDYRVQQEMLRRLIPDQKVGIYFSPSFLSAPKEACPTISVVHDATYVLYPEFQPPGVADYLHRCVDNTCRNASRIVTLSENSKRDIARFYQYPRDRIHAIPLAPDSGFFQRHSEEEVKAVKRKYDLPDRYILAVNMGNPKKNAAGLFNAYARVSEELRSELRLVIVGEWSAGALDLPKLADEVGIADEVRLTGHVPREDLYCIYAGAALFCFPSLHEGFGLPVQEAMASGVPVICSNAASLPEVAGDAAVLLGPTDESGWTSAIERLLTSEETRTDLSERGKSWASQFSWQRTGRATLAVLEKVSSVPGVHLSVGSTWCSPSFEPIEIEGLTCAISVDDVRPEPGFGGLRDKGPLGYLLRLHEESGSKFTLFVPTNWKGKWPVEEHLDWLEWLVSEPCFEVACHGHFHATEPGSPDPGEFRGGDAERLGSILQESLGLFAKVGHRPLGVKAPGWLLEPSAYSVFDRRFQYVADHVVGTQLSRLSGARLVRVPYLYTIDELGPWTDRGHVILQSHVAPEGRITNGWSERLYERVRAFVKTGKRLRARFATMAEITEGTALSQVAQIRSRSPVRLTEDRRLHGGEVKLLGDEAGVLYNAPGDPCPLELRPDNATIAILSRNRREYLADLLKSIDGTSPKELGRMVLLNNCEDDSAETLRTCFSNWRLVELNDRDYPDEPKGLAWLKQNMKELLPRPAERIGPTLGWTAPRSIGWLRNQQFLVHDRAFLVSFDDDFLVKPGWWEYYVRFQRAFAAHAVMNNFGAFIMCRTVLERIGWIDERFLGSHGYEDNDYAARIAEAKIRWVLGFNTDHDWRSAEEGNLRGSMTGADYFIHRYAYRSGGYSARRQEPRQDPVRATWNARWFTAKWEGTSEDTGIFPRPPFRGQFLKRKVCGEPDWHPQELPSSPQSANIVEVKTSDNTPVAEIDPIANPVTGTMVDRYVFAAHWCKGKRVLDAACGYGYGSAILLAMGAESVVGADVDGKALAYAKSRYEGPRLSFRTFDLVQGQPGVLGLFDVVVSIETMEHLPRESVPQYLNNLRAHVRADGTVLITTPCRGNSVWHYPGGTHRYEYSAQEFRDVVSEVFRDFTNSFMGIEEFRVHNEPRLYSRLAGTMNADTRIMLAVIKGLR